MEVNCTHGVPVPCELCVFYALKILKAHCLRLSQISIKKMHGGYGLIG